MKSYPTGTNYLELEGSLHNAINGSTLKFYIGQGLRQDLAKRFSSQLLDSTAQVLARHIQSEEEISNIIREIQAESNR